MGVFLYFKAYIENKMTLEAVRIQSCFWGAKVELLKVIDIGEAFIKDRAKRKLAKLRQLDRIIWIFQTNIKET